MVEQYRPKMAL